MTTPRELSLPSRTLSSRAGVIIASSEFGLPRPGSMHSFFLQPLGVAHCLPLIHFGLRMKSKALSFELGFLANSISISLLPAASLLNLLSFFSLSLAEPSSCQHHQTSSHLLLQQFPLSSSSELYLHFFLPRSIPLSTRNLISLGRARPVTAALGWTERRTGHLPLFATARLCLACNPPALTRARALHATPPTSRRSQTSICILPSSNFARSPVRTISARPSKSSFLSL